MFCKNWSSVVLVGKERTILSLVASVLASPVAISVWPVSVVSIAIVGSVPSTVAVVSILAVGSVVATVSAPSVVSVPGVSSSVGSGSGVGISRPLAVVSIVSVGS